MRPVATADASHPDRIYGSVLDVFGIFAGHRDCRTDLRGVWSTALISCAHGCWPTPPQVDRDQPSTPPFPRRHNLTHTVEWRCSRVLRIVILASGSAAISAGGRDPDVLGSQADSTDLRRIAG